MAAGTALVPAWLAASCERLVKPGSRRKLVVIQLAGGSDGLNVIAPVGDPRYRALRPEIGLRHGEGPAIGSGLAWNPAAAPLAQLQDAGHLHVLQAVGYPNPHRSHFRSQDVWESASLEITGTSRGWIGRYLDRECPGAPSHKAVSMTSAVPLALRGEDSTGFAYGDLGRTQKHLRTVGTQAPPTIPGLPPDDYVTKVFRQTEESANYLTALSSRRQPSVAFPKTDIGRHLRQIATLLLADAETDFYYAVHGGFDTHAAQAGKHADRIGEYSEAMLAFTRELQRARLFDDTLVLTFSEFGRRAEQNSSLGTDHGKANLAWLIGGRVRQGSARALVPDLGSLDEGDLAMRIDFRSIYATIVSRWLGEPHVDLVGDYPILDFI